MPELIAADVALLPPPAVAERAVDLSAALAATESKGLRLDEHHLPHITLMQLFVRSGELPLLFEQIEVAIRGVGPLRLRVSGGARSGTTAWMAIEPSPPLRELHDRLMHGLRGVERPGGTPAAFVDGNARVADVVWVTAFRAKAGFGAFTPHITLGHAARAPRIEPLEFEATTVAACHLGRFCTCRRIFREWTLRVS